MKNDNRVPIHPRKISFKQYTLTDNADSTERTIDAQVYKIENSMHRFFTTKLNGELEEIATFPYEDYKVTTISAL